VTTALLDTHALVWAITNPDRLGSSARSIITDPTIDLAASAASAWELASKVRLGRFPSAEPIVAQYDALVDRLGARRLDITTTHALRSGSLNWTHRDPFDRMLAAQAMLEHAVLVSVDRSFHELAGLSIVW
jgi:PIN domain nuclease of toxin-antitoxin system